MNEDLINRRGVKLLSFKSRYRLCVCERNERAGEATIFQTHLFIGRSWDVAFVQTDHRSIEQAAIRAKDCCHTLRMNWER
ncbi:hypothetical protein CEXT_651851 [Caerostris extrusa]|uniref:Uncharacterized protein n=1 Tax=Caerostris extrusa TaxID=172846 RepID=A0AAV4XA01_CAEEX|nr:hypothetical protein CEXT_651851 [Caerostris extrusa]